MFYRQLAEVSIYIADSTHEMQEILQMLYLKAMSGLQVDALVYEELDQYGELKPKSSFGIEVSDRSGLQPSFNISESTPCTDAIKNDKVVWIDTLPSWPKNYATMSALDLPKSFKTMICSPVENHGLPIGCLSIFSKTKLAFDDSIVEFVEAISMILSNAAMVTQSAIGRKQVAESGSQIGIMNADETALSLLEYQKPLTERQNLILKLISEGRTNAAIADVLGYSESLIRQETIKIYAKLGCSGRNEAAQIFLKSSEHKQQIGA